MPSLKTTSPPVQGRATCQPTDRNPLCQAIVDGRSVLAASLRLVGDGSHRRAVRTGGRFTIALGAEPTTLDPQLVDDGSERAVNDNIYETLVARTPKGELVPGLADGMPMQSGADAWRFKLRPGIKFSNGEPFNADAVVYSVKRIIDPKFDSNKFPISQRSPMPGRSTT